MASTTPSSSVSTSSVVLAVAGTLSAGLLAYAVYFDHKRRTNPEFRRQLKKEQKRAQRVQEESAKAAERGQKERIRAVMDVALAEGVPDDSDEKETYFMQEVARGESMLQDGSAPIDAALSFYRALKVYPQPRELMEIYDKTIPKPVFDILAEMIALDPSIAVRPDTSLNVE